MSTAQLNKVHISFPNSLINMDKHASMHAHTHMHARKLAGIYAQRHICLCADKFADIQAHTHAHTHTHATHVHAR